MMRTGEALAKRVLPLCAALVAVPAVAQAYKWVDADGRTHFSDVPPPDRKADRITIKPQVPGDPAAAARSLDWKAQLEASGVRRLEAQKHKDAADQKAKTDEYNCRLARSDLDTLQRGRVFRHGKDGQREYLEDKDRPAALLAAQEKVERFCR